MFKNFQGGLNCLSGGLSPPQPTLGAATTDRISRLLNKVKVGSRERNKPLQLATLAVLPGKIESKY